MLDDSHGLNAAAMPRPVDSQSGNWGCYLRAERLEEVVLITMDDPSGRANKTTDLFKDEFEAVLSDLETGPEPAGILIRSAKSSFGVGGDIGQVTGFAARGEAASFTDSERIKELFRRLERLPFPSVALLGGTAAGGSWELALACNVRLCVDDDSIRLGLPEVTFGLVPGAGGMVRLPHMVGLERAGALIAGAQMQTPSRAFEDGLVNGLVPHRDALLRAGIDAIIRHRDLGRPWDRPGHVAKDTVSFTGQVSGAAGATAPRKALDALARITRVPFVDASAIESRCFAECATSYEAQALIGLGFFDRNLLRRTAADLDPAIQSIGGLLAEAFKTECESIRREGNSDGMLTRAATSQGYEFPDTARDVNAPHDREDSSHLAERLIFAQVSAALRALGADERLPAVVFNVGSVEKGGFPRHHGGVLRFIEHIGTSDIVARTATMERRHGAAFTQPFDADGLARRLRSAELADRNMGNSE